MAIRNLFDLNRFGQLEHDYRLIRALLHHLLSQNGVSKFTKSNLAKIAKDHLYSYKLETNKRSTVYGKHILAKTYPMQNVERYE